MRCAYATVLVQKYVKKLACMVREMISSTEKRQLIHGMIKHIMKNEEQKYIGQLLIKQEDK